jgi:hypothetical protein
MKSKPAASGRMAGAAGEMYGEGSWKADAEYRQGVKEFSDDSEKIARGAAAELDEDDDEANEPPPSKDENEW